MTIETGTRQESFKIAKFTLNCCRANISNSWGEFPFGSLCEFFFLRLLQWLSDLCEQWMTTGTIDLHLFDILFAGKRKRHTHKTRAEWKCASDRIWMANKFRVLSMSKGGTHNLLLSSFPIEMFTHFSAIAFFWLWFRIHMLAKNEKQLRNNLCTEFFVSRSDKMWGVTWHWQIFPTITFQLELLRVCTFYQVERI